MFHDYHLRPMLLSEEKHIFQDDDYFYEIKFDGIRAFIYVSKDEFVILSRNGNKLTNQYPELRDIQKQVFNHHVIFDGEIIATENGIPSFSLLQKRNRSKRVSEKLIEEVPVSFVAFDVLYDNRDLTNFPLMKRKEILNQFLDSLVFHKSVLYENGPMLFKMVKKLGLEGVVLKKKNSLYTFGCRTHDWIKVKNIQVDSFLVHGYIENEKTYSLLLGEERDHALYYVGKVSVGKNHPIIKELKKKAFFHNQFVNFTLKAFFIRPVRKVRVRYLERLKSGVLRHPVFDE